MHAKWCRWRSACRRPQCAREQPGVQVELLQKQHGAALEAALVELDEPLADIGEAAAVGAACAQLANASGERHREAQRAADSTRQQLLSAQASLHGLQDTVSKVPAGHTALEHWRRHCGARRRQQALMSCCIASGRSAGCQGGRHCVSSFVTADSACSQYPASPHTLCGVPQCQLAAAACITPQMWTIQHALHFPVRMLVLGACVGHAHAQSAAVWWWCQKAGSCAG